MKRLSYALAVLLVAVLSLTFQDARAQSTAQQTIPGALTISGCPGGNTPCFNQFSSNNPMPIAVYDSGNHSGYCYTSNGSAAAATFQVCGGGGGGSGTVTSVSVVTANGLSGTVATPTTTPAITLVVGAINLSSATGLPISTGVSGLGTGMATFLATPSSANLASTVTDETGTGALVFGTAPTITLANGSGLPVSTGISGLGTGIAAWLATPNSANLATAMTDETGTGALVFAGSPTFTGTVAAANVTLAGTEAITSASATAFAVGASGATNPVLAVDDSTASVVTGIVVKGAATGGTTTITTTDTGSNTGLDIEAKGTSPFTINGTATGAINIGNSASGVIKIASGSANPFEVFAGSTDRFSIGCSGACLLWVPAANATASQPEISFTGAAVSGVTAATEQDDFLMDFSATRQHASNTTVALQPSVHIKPRTETFATTGGVITLAPTLDIAGAPTGGTNSTLTTAAGINIETDALTNVTNGYGLIVNAPTGATTNYAAQLNGLVTLPSIGSDAGHTDSSVCQDTTTHALYAGSGTVGICLGTSSGRYKNNIVAMKDGLAQINALKPVNFFYNKDHGDNGAKQQYGFLAEDMVGVLPKLVGLDKEGKPNSVDIVGLVPILVKAVQELKADNDNLAQQVSELKSQLKGGR